jgi:hypothetical protein
MVFLRGLVVWVIIVLAEFVHGAARGVLLEPYVGGFRARQIAVFTGSAIILAIAAVFVRWIRAGSIYHLIATGLLWLVLMLGFEIAFGRYVMGYSWDRIASDFNLVKGGLLPIGMVVLTLAPIIAARVRRLI